MRTNVPSHPSPVTCELLAKKVSRPRVREYLLHVAKEERALREALELPMDGVRLEDTVVVANDGVGRLNLEASTRFLNDLPDPVGNGPYQASDGVTLEPEQVVILDALAVRPLTRQEVRGLYGFTPDALVTGLHDLERRGLVARRGEGTRAAPYQYYRP